MYQEILRLQTRAPVIGACGLKSWFPEVTLDEVSTTRCNNTLSLYLLLHPSRQTLERCYIMYPAPADLLELENMKRSELLQGFVGVREIHHE